MMHLRSLRAPAPYCDLHVHSTFSDGLCTPTELCRMADALQLRFIALCDHDATDGLSSMARAAKEVSAMRQAQGKPPLTAVPGVEVSTGADGRTHILCYGATPQNAALADLLNEAAQDRRTRMQQMLQKLKALGVALTPDMQALPDAPSAGRAQLARAMVASGAVPSIQAAFRRYLSPGGPAYVARHVLPTGDALVRLRAMGLVAVLAHPMRSNLSPEALRQVLPEWKAQGLCGLEAYHPSANRRQVRALDALARSHGLLVTGGSDYHGDKGAHARMGQLPGGWTTCPRDAEALCETVSRIAHITL